MNGALDGHREMHDMLSVWYRVRHLDIVCRFCICNFIVPGEERMALSDCKCVPRQMRQNASIRPPDRCATLIIRVFRNYRARIRINYPSRIYLSIVLKSAH